MPENTLLVLSPWVALVGLVGFMAAVVVLAKKRRQ
jgi:LPXTG-motif cell wall-anchored protein